MQKLKNKGLFTVEGYERNFTGYSNPEENWNGWACPYFELDEALEILKLFDGIRFHDHKELSSGLTVITWLDDDNEMNIVEGEKIEAFGQEIEVFAIGTCGWCWEGVNCDPEGPEEDDEEDDEHKTSIEALVEKSDNNPKESVVIIHKDGVDADWWGVYWGTKKNCESLANELNKAFRRLKL